MNFKIIFYILALQSIAIPLVKAQQKEYTTWGAWFHTQKFSSRWGASFDGQFRSANHADYLKNVLLRPSANYYLNKKAHLDLGYAYIASHGRSGDTKTFRPEHRIFQQFIYSHKVGANTQLSHRLRLEQRFLGSNATQDPYFAQRLRYFIRGVIPFNRDSTFTKGTFLALQNETFANIQNKHKVNQHLFDQNRAYVAFGYRFNKMMDLEAGYLNQYIKHVESYTLNHVLQIAVYTRFGN